MKLKQRLFTLTADKKQLQKRSLRIKKSFDEVNALLNAPKKRK